MVGVKKLWKSLRTSVAASGKVIKQKLRKRKGSANERFDHYNFSDDDEADGKLGKKFQSWKMKAMGCVVGHSVIDPGKDHFVYVTDLYCSAAPPPVPMDCDDADKSKGGSNDGASGSSPAEERKEASPEEVRLEAEASAASLSKMKKSVWWAEAEGRSEEEVDGHAEEFISKFYDGIRLQRQKSFVEYREMLERGTTSR